MGEMHSTMRAPAERHVRLPPKINRKLNPDPKRDPAALPPALSMSDKRLPGSSVGDYP
jgi:hypothetical protein